MAISVKKLKKYIKDEFDKMQEFIAVITNVFSSKMTIQASNGSFERKHPPNQMKFFLMVQNT